MYTDVGLIQTVLIVIRCAEVLPKSSPARRLAEQERKKYKSRSILMGYSMTSDEYLS
jgi:hypothetical protein